MTLKTIRKKDLGVNVDNKLKFSNHTEIQVNKANRILHLIKRLIFVALVRLILEYSNIPWYPMLQKARILIDELQRRTVSWIQTESLSNLKNEERLRQLKLTTWASYRSVRGGMMKCISMSIICIMHLDSFLGMSQNHNRAWWIQIEKAVLQDSIKATFVPLSRGRFVECTLSMSGFCTEPG